MFITISVRVNYFFLVTAHQKQATHCRKSLMKSLKSCLAISALLMLAGCGGGGGSSTPTPTNTAPVANAGNQQSLMMGATVTLDGSGSTDAEHDALTYSWALTSKPVGSSATLSSPTNVQPTFTADLAGTYTATLIVNDGKASSNSATVNVTASRNNAAPIANAGTAQSVVAGSTVTLDGSTSTDANGDTLSYNWSLTSKPTGSTATLSSSTSVRASPPMWPALISPASSSMMAKPAATLQQSP